MKITYRIPTEAYAYVELEHEYSTSPSPEDVKVNYEKFVDAFKPKPEQQLDAKEYQAWLINQLLGLGNGVEDMEKMSQEQKFYSHELKKALATIKRRNENSV